MHLPGDMIRQAFRSRRANHPRHFDGILDGNRNAVQFARIWPFARSSSARCASANGFGIADFDRIQSRIHRFDPLQKGVRHFLAEKSLRRIPWASSWAGKTKKLSGMFTSKKLRSFE
jgi:hypothetical protein